jgi:hypothetical protein
MTINVLWPVNWRDSLIASIVIISFVSLFFIAPIPQDLAYHKFADTRAILGINNFFNVVSNLPFLLVGLAGLYYLYRNWDVNNSWSWLILFTAILCVGLGSAYYHLNPENNTLSWDRLPMAVGFMALFVIVLADNVNNRLEKWLLLPMCLVGVTSVVYWHMTDDLRIYVWVQFVSIALLLIIVSVYKPTHLKTKYLIYAFIFYMLSKLAEHFDRQIYEIMDQTLSGHTIKHLLAAIATFFFYALLKRRVT